MSAALYNRYRPRTFAEVVGQEHVTAALTAALASGRTHHAYLFSGPRGCGKTTSARILAASLNCVDGPTPTPCGVCEQCVAIRTGSSLDVVEIDAASHGGVEDARDLRERALYVPASARYRVFVIDEAHQVSRDGFNALLKIVEEPPPYLVFVFATTEPEKVLPTIRSRTFQYQFRLMPPGVMRELLRRICVAEGVEVAPEVLPLVVRAGAGSARDSLSVLDQLIAGEATSYVRAAALLGVTDVVLLDDAVAALSARDGAALFGVVERVVAAGHDPRRFAADLLERLRDLLLLQAVPEAVERGLVEGVPPDQLELMRQQATSLGAAELSRSADTVHAGLVEMRGTTSPRLLLELVCARLLLPAADGSAAATLARLDAVERRITLGTPAATRAPAPPAPLAPPAPPAARSSAPTAPAGPESTPDPAATGLDVAALREAWPLVLDAVKSRSRVPHAMLAQYAQVLAVDGQRLTLGMALAQIARQFQAGPGVEILTEALAEKVGGRWSVQVTVGAPGAETTVDGFAPGDGPSDVEPVAASAAPAEPPDPVGLLRSAFGATVIGEIDNGG